MIIQLENSNYHFEPEYPNSKYYLYRLMPIIAIICYIISSWGINYIFSIFREYPEDDKILFIILSIMCASIPAYTLFALIMNISGFKHYPYFYTSYWSSST